MNNKLISLIGGGKMAQALVNGFVNKKYVNKRNILVSDPNKYQHNFFNSLGVETTTCNIKAVNNRDIIIFSTKPQVLSTVFDEIKKIDLTDTLIFSILAGTSKQKFLDNINIDKIVRVMPNTPAIIGKGLTIWYPYNCTMNDLEITKKLLNSIGKEIRVDNESYMDMSTALSGSGPAYLYLLAETMIETGVHIGLSREMSKEMVNETLRGAVEYLCQSNEHPSILRNEITSPGGTTASAIYAFEKNGFRGNISDSIWAAYKRALELDKLK